MLFRHGRKTCAFHKRAERALWPPRQTITWQHHVGFGSSMVRCKVAAASRNHGFLHYPRGSVNARPKRISEMKLMFWVSALSALELTHLTPDMVDSATSQDWPLVDWTSAPRATPRKSCSLRLQLHTCGVEESQHTVNNLLQLSTEVPAPIEPLRSQHRSSRRTAPRGRWRTHKSLMLFEKHTTAGALPLDADCGAK